MLKEVPVFDRPREKAIKYGVNSLSNIELIAILLRTVQNKIMYWMLLKT